ncbi:hypothetical protein [Jiangella asiatica]|uniref:Glucuronyl hydrolase n=1 Tax=Jiangella asiatica TaxID=2530372 RepID=A0A4R5CP21_9ACTN|nr:hypothetical protein [Jiangella asiatica]TDE00144.1 hypothetical protein E1269_26360 [Jiangella asiatica]
MTASQTDHAPLDMGPSDADVRAASSRALEDVKRGLDPVLSLIEDADDGEVPAFSYSTGGYRPVAPYNPHAWATFQWVGFLAGRLWLVGTHFGDDRVCAAAMRVARSVADTLAAAPPRFSAAGSDLFYASCLGARISGDSALADTAVEAVARYAENFDDRFGVFFQVRDVNRAVIDTGLNLLPFYWAAQRRPELRDIAVAHNAALLDYGIIRADGSAHQAIEFDLDSGAPARRYSMQGYDDDATWARGQAWAMHNYTNVYEATGDARFLDVARRACHWYVEHLPADHVPFYDFDDPAAPGVPRDTCSAAIAANALLRLGRLDPASAGWAERIAARISGSLFRDHLSPGGVLLHSSWGRLPAEKAGAGFSRFPMEDVMPYGNYWVVEAAYRWAHADWTPLSLAPAVKLVGSGREAE